MAKISYVWWFSQNPGCTDVKPLFLALPNPLWAPTRNLIYLNTFQNIFFLGFSLLASQSHPVTLHPGVYTS